MGLAKVWTKEEDTLLLTYPSARAAWESGNFPHRNLNAIASRRWKLESGTSEPAEPIPASVLPPALQAELAEAEALAAQANTLLANLKVRATAVAAIYPRWEAARAALSAVEAEALAHNVELPAPVLGAITSVVEPSAPKSDNRILDPFLALDSHPSVCLAVYGQARGITGLTSDGHSPVLTGPLPAAQALGMLWHYCEEASEKKLMGSFALVDPENPKKVFYKKIRS